MAPHPDPATAARHLRAAWIVAVAADALQLAAFPFFAEGFLSPANDVLDVIASVALVRLLGWHPALLPTLAAELLPGVDLVPTWTAAVGIVAWSRRNARTAAPPPATPRTSHAEVVPDAGDAPRPPAPHA
jgi:hypothetical protein